MNAEGERVVAVLASPEVQESLDRHAVLPGTMMSDELVYGRLKFPALGSRMA